MTMAVVTAYWVGVLLVTRSGLVFLNGNWLRLASAFMMVRCYGHNIARGPAVSLWLTTYVFGLVRRWSVWMSDILWLAHPLFQWQCVLQVAALSQLFTCNPESIQPRQWRCDIQRTAQVYWGRLMHARTWTHTETERMRTRMHKRDIKCKGGSRTWTNANLHRFFCVGRENVQIRLCIRRMFKDLLGRTVIVSSLWGLY